MWEVSKNGKNSISSALVSDFIHLEFCLFAYKSGSGTRGSTKDRLANLPPFSWPPLPSLTSQHQDLIRVNACYLRPQREPVPTSLLSLVSGTLWSIITLLAHTNMQLHLQLYLGEKKQDSSIHRTWEQKAAVWLRLRLFIKPEIITMKVKISYAQIFL